MKKILIFGMIALAVIGCVVAAGCTSTTTLNSSTNANGDFIVGTWSLDDRDITVVFTDDHKGVITNGDNKINFTWKKTIDGKYQLDNEYGNQTIMTLDKNNRILTNDSGDTLTKI